MNLRYFPNFVRALCPSVAGYGNETLIHIGTEFKQYLQEHFKGDAAEKLDGIWNIDPATVLNNSRAGSYSLKGYHPALCLHFTEFIKQKINKK